MNATMLDLDLLSTFVAVADTSSFSKAAVQLGTTKGTVSRNIARLEGLVEAELLHRTSRNVSLSTAGIALYERTAPYLRALREAVCSLPEREEQPAGELRLTAPVDLGVTWLPDVLWRFALRYPTIRCDVRLTNRPVDLVAEGFDVALRAAPMKLKDSSLSVRKLASGELRMYASPKYIARRGEPRTVGDAAHEWVAFGAAMRLVPFPKGVRPRFTGDEFLFLREMVRAGAGVGMLPGFLAEPLVTAGELVRVLPQVDVRGSALFLLYPASKQVPRKVAAFRDFVVDTLQARPFWT